MEWGPPIATIAVALVALVAALVAIQQARRAVAARQRAEHALAAATGSRDEARRLAEQVADAVRRLAESTPTTAATAPPHRATAFAVHQTSKRGYRLLNTGVTVDRALVIGLEGRVVVDDPRPRRLEPGDSIRFSLPRGRGEQPRVAITGVVTSADGSSTPFRTELAL
jgi:hypothetical protein